MELKRFYADDMAHGIRDVKRALGADAVILGSSRVGRQVEILAAADYDEALYKELTDKGVMGLPQTREPAPVQPIESALSSQQAIEQELAELKGILKEEIMQLARLRETGAVPQPVPVVTETVPTRGPRAVARSRFEALGLSSDICQKLADRFPLAGNELPSWQSLMKLVGSFIKIEADEILSEGGVCAVVGSTGVGKTTTVAKLAARYVQRHGSEAVGIISTDAFRIGGQEQLATFSRVLGVQFLTASTARELKLRLRELRHKSLVLIDTAGMSQRDMLLSEQLDSLSESGVEIKPYLVLSAASQLRVTLEIIDAFKKLQIRGAIVTKLDEAGSLGPALSGLIRHKLPLTYTCDGQDVPEDINQASRTGILTSALRLLEADRQAQKNLHQEEAVMAATA